MISLLCPVYNEEKFISSIVDFFENSPPNEKELIFIDGGSTDNTIKLIESYASKNNNIRLLDNKNKYVSFALNIGILNCKGDPIIRLDAHTIYRSDYCVNILKAFKKSKADVVGGPMRKIGNSDLQKAIAYCTSNFLGIGDSKIHDLNYSGYSDHVYLGAWNKSLFEKIGYFDENLIRNQDDEFHYRANYQGKKIYLSSDIYSEYSPRDSFSKLFNQYFQYGLFKPYVLKKIRTGIKIRHLIPSLFVLYILALTLFFKYTSLFSILCIYILLTVFFGFKSKFPTKIKLYSIIIYPIIHLAYGSGFIIGSIFSIYFIKKLFLN
jgi:succinoglycan biosynthesis protein ExoA